MFKKSTLAAAALLAGFSAAAQAQAVPAPVDVAFQSAPSVLPGLFEAPRSAASSPVAIAPAAQAAPSASIAPAVGGAAPDFVPDINSVDEKELGWLLPFELRPTFLRVQEVPKDVNTLLLDVPSAQEISLWLPGRGLDSAQRARYEVTKFFNALVTDASAQRDAQLQALVPWVAQTDLLRLKLSSDAWQQYYFNTLSIATVKRLQERVQSQSAPAAADLMHQINAIVARVTPLVTAAPTAESRMAWYGVLLQIQTGLHAYSDQLTKGDSRLVDVLSPYLQQHPEGARPPGDAPKKPSPEAAAAPHVATALAAPVKALAPASQRIQAEASTLSLWLLIGLVGAFGGWIYMRVKRRNKNKVSV